MGFDPDKLPESFKKCMAADPITIRHAIMDKMNTDSATAKREEICEREIQGQICQYLRMRGVFFSWQPMNKRSQLREGSPDYMLSYNHVPIALEAKILTGRLSEAQQRVMAEMVGAPNKWHYHIVHGVEDVKAILDKIDVDTR